MQVRRGNNREGARTLWVLLGLLLIFGVPAFGQAPVPPAPASRPPTATPTTFAGVQLEGRTLFEVAATEGVTAAERAERIERRLQNLVQREAPVRPFGRDDIRRSADGDWQIFLGGELIMEVTPEDAQDVLATPEELALLWGQELAGAVAEARTTRENPLQGIGILIRNSVRDLVVSTVTWLPRLASALILAVIFWLLAKLAAWVVCVVANRTRLDPNLRQLARAVAFYGLWAVGAVAILATFGFETGGIVAALGISGFILGFAFKDILSHFLAGLMLLLGRQFRIGDQIVVKDQEGTVERIELRALHLRTYDNRLVIIPNAEVFNSIITSNTASPYRRREFVVGIGFEDDIGRALQVALEAVRGTPGVMTEPEPDVLVDELAPSTVNLRVRFFMNSLRADYLKVGSECMRRVKEAFDREGISMPTEIFTLVFDNAAEAADEVKGVLAGGPSRRNAHRGGPADEAAGPDPSIQEDPTDRRRAA